MVAAFVRWTRRSRPWPPARLRRPPGLDPALEDLASLLGPGSVARHRPGLQAIENRVGVPGHVLVRPAVQREAHRPPIELAEERLMCCSKLTGSSGPGNTIDASGSSAAAPTPSSLAWHRRPTTRAAPACAEADGLPVASRRERFAIPTRDRRRTRPGTRGRPRAWRRRRTCRGAGPGGRAAPLGAPFAKCWETIRSYPRCRPCRPSVSALALCKRTA